MMTDSSDFNYEENIVSNPFKIKPWILYIESKKRKSNSIRDVFVLYERAVKQLPGSYKLWYGYLLLRVSVCSTKSFKSLLWQQTNECFDRALLTMSKMPVIWLEYCKFLIRQRFITRVRKTFDRALKNLPVTQHQKIWVNYVKWIDEDYVPIESGIEVYRRYLRLKPNEIVNFITFLIKKGEYLESCKEMEKLLNDVDRIDSLPLTKFDVWSHLCEIIQAHPKSLRTFNVEKVLREGIDMYKTENGKIWRSLANYYINIGLFEKARDVFEEGMANVNTVRDFTVIFTAYSAFEEQIVKIQMQNVKGGESESNESESDSDEEEEDEDVNFSKEDDLNMKMKRWERLLDRRPLLLSDVKLRQNPYNVKEWLKRTKLFPKDPKRVVSTFSQALETIDPKKVSGRLSTLWISFAKYYEKEMLDIENSRKIYNMSLTKEFPRINDYSEIICEFAEMEIRNGNLGRARDLLNTFTSAKKTGRTVFDSVYRSVKIWEILVDVEESVGDLERTRKVYERMIHLKVCTPSVILAYASLMEEQKFFEESFKVYEKGIKLFNYPVVYNVWVPYLIKFIERYGGRKVERTRDLFENALEKIPKEYAFNMYLLYAKFEEEHGMIKHALEIIDRGLDIVPEEEKELLLSVYVSTSSEYFGISKVRSIFEKAINNFPEKLLKNVYEKYIELEIKLGEIDRARSLYANCSNYTTDISFFNDWEEFEKMYGNIDTYKEMYKIKERVIGSSLSEQKLG